MCIPVAALPLAAAAVSAAGSLFGGLTGAAQAQYETSLARRNAALESERARDSIDRGRDEARDLYRQIGQTKGSQIAAMAANGLDVSYGSALTLQQDTAALAQEDVGNLYRNVSERTRGHDITGSNFEAEALAAKSRGRSALVNSVFEAGSSLMGGFVQQKAMRGRLGITGGGGKKVGPGAVPWFIGPPGGP